MWVNGVLSYQDGDATGQRGGRFLPRPRSETMSPASGSLLPMIDSHGLFLLLAAASCSGWADSAHRGGQAEPLPLPDDGFARAGGRHRDAAGDIVSSFETGTGNTLGHIAIVVGLGTMLGKMMAESGASDRIAETLIQLFGERRVPWSMMCASLIVGLPVFFEVGFVLLVPIAFTVARRTAHFPDPGRAAHGGRPFRGPLRWCRPHPAAMLAVTIFHADVGRTILYALLIGIPSAAIAGPIYAAMDRAQDCPRRAQSHGGRVCSSTIPIAVCPALASP